MRRLRTALGAVRVDGSEDGEKKHDGADELDRELRRRGVGGAHGRLFCWSSFAAAGQCRCPSRAIPAETQGRGRKPRLGAGGEDVGAVDGSAGGVEGGRVEARRDGRAADGTGALRDCVEAGADDGHLAADGEAEGDGRVEVAAAERGEDVDEDEEDEAAGAGDGHLGRGPHGGRSAVDRVEDRLRGGGPGSDSGPRCCIVVGEGNERGPALAPLSGSAQEPWRGVAASRRRLC